MKKIFGLIISFVLAMSIFTACSFSSGSQKRPNPEKQQRESSDFSDSQSPRTAQDNALPDETSFIGEERAKEIALERAGISPEGVIFDRVELDRDSGVWHYEVEFRKDRTEYDADIKADDGAVLSFESDFDD